MKKIQDETKTNIEDMKREILERFKVQSEILERFNKLLSYDNL